MSNKGVVFMSKNIVHPGAYDNIDASAMEVVNQSASNIPILVGSSNSGKKGEVMWFNSLPEARKVLKGGDLLTGLDLIFNPLPEGGGGASRAGVLVVNENTQSTGTAGTATFKSKSYGASDVQVTLSSTGVLSICDWDTNTVEQYKDFGKVMKIKYTGAETVAKVSIVGTTLSITVGETPTVLVTVSLTDSRYSTIGKLCDYLNRIVGIDCIEHSYRYTSIDSSLLVPCETSIITEAVVESSKASLAMVNAYSDLVEVVPVEVTAPFDVKLTGGVTGEAPASWAPFFTQLKNHFYDSIVVLTDSSSIHAECAAHLSLMEQRNQKQLMYTGGAVGETVKEAVSRASDLNYSRAVLGFPEILHPSYKDGKTPLPMYFTGALIAGRICGLPVSEPATFKYCGVVGLGRDLIAGDEEVNELIEGGVCTLERVKSGGVRVAQGLTTYISSNNTLYREISVRRASDVTSERVRNSLEAKLVGSRNVVDSTVRAIVVDELDKAIKDELIVAYRNITIKFEGTAVSIDYEAAPVIPTNFVLINSRFVPEIVQ